MSTNNNISHDQGTDHAFEDDSVWQELHNEESREIQRHQHRTNSSLHIPGASPIPILTRQFPSDRMGDNFTIPKIQNAFGNAAQAISSAALKVKKTIEHNQHSGTYYGPYKQSDQNAQNSHASAAAEFGLNPMTHELHNGDLHFDEGSPNEPLLSGDNDIDDFNLRSQQNDAPKFVLLDRFRLAPNRDGWGTVANLDLFFTSLYSYYYHRGLIPIIGKGVVELVSLFFTLWLSIFLFVYLDWGALYTCRDEETCRAYLSDYILENPFQRRNWLWRLMILSYILLYTAYGIFALSAFIKTAKDALEAKFVFEDKLGISSQKLEGGAVEWHEIVRKLGDLQNSGDYRIAINGQNIEDELIVAQRIMRRENFMISFFNKDLLDLSVPIPWMQSGKSKTKFYSKTIEWCIYFCVLSYMFNHKYEVRPSFCNDVRSLQKRFVLCGIGHMVFTPFLLFFMMLHYFLQNLYDLRSSRQYLGPREWSSIAKWKFREFNELPHVFERRMDPSYKAAEDYLKLFMPSSLLNSIGRIIVFLSGSLGAVCVALAAMNDSILLHVKIGNWNLVWYLGVLGVVYSGGKGLLPNGTVEKSHQNLFSKMDDSLGVVATHTHYYPDFWRNRGWDQIIRNELTELFQYKVQLFAMEVLSILVAPIILCYNFPRCAENVCAFVRSVKIDVPGAGDHCGFATFDFDLFDDGNWEGELDKNYGNLPRRGSNPPTNLNSLNSNRAAIYNKLSEQKRPKAIHGKMEKSFFNFKAVNPLWKCSSENAIRLVDRIEAYQKQQEQEAIAMARERQLHMAAALLELNRLQSKDTPADPELRSDHIHEDYIQGITSPERDKSSSNLINEEISRNNGELSPLHTNQASHLAFTSNPNMLSLGISDETTLNKSIFDAGASLLNASDIGHSFPSMSYLRQSSIAMEDDPVQRQYMLLDQYHDDKVIKSQSRQSVNDNNTTL